MTAAKYWKYKKHVINARRLFKSVTFMFVTLNSKLRSTVKNPMAVRSQCQANIPLATFLTYQTQKHFGAVCNEPHCAFCIYTRRGYRARTSFTELISHKAYVVSMWLLL